MLLIRAGKYSLHVGKCPGQRRPATARNGEKGRTFWLPGLAIDIQWGDQ